MQWLDYYQPLHGRVATKLFFLMHIEKAQSNKNDFAFHSAACSNGSACLII
jgi:hypothetical protein